MRPHKITLGQCKAQGATVLLFYCDGPPGLRGPFCRNRSEMPLADAIGRMRGVPLDCDTMVAAREVGICFGDDG